MIKRLLILLTSLIILFSLVSCKDNGNDGPSNETQNETSGNDEPVYAEEAKRLENPEKYYKVVEFELTREPFRDVIVDYMRKQASLEWVCSKDFNISEQWKSWGINLEFKKGQTYHGIPYADTEVTYRQFTEQLVDGTFTADSSKWLEIYGVQCISSIRNAIQQFDGQVDFTGTIQMPSYTKFKGKMVGEYTVPSGVNQTKLILEENGQDVMFEAYMQLQKGDIIATRDDQNGLSHYRVLVEDPTIYKNGSGKVIPSRCSIKTIEQTNSFDKQRTDGVKTTWFVDHVYSFTTLYEQDYIPLTLESYSKPRSEMEVPYILLDEANKPEILAKKTFNGTIKSNFPIRYAEIDFLDKDGNSVKKETLMNLDDTLRSLSLRKYALQIFDGLESGTYTMVISAGIAIDTAELHRVEFTLN